MRISEKEIDYWDTQEKWVEYEKFDPGCSAVQKSSIEPVPGVQLSVPERDSFWKNEKFGLDKKNVENTEPLKLSVKLN